MRPLHLGLVGAPVMITGAARGQGFAAAKLFAEHGARVAVADIDAEALESSLDEIRRVADGDVIGIELDVSDESSWAAARQRLESEFGGLDVLINNAGVPLRKVLTRTTPEEFDRVMSVNVRGPFLGIRALASLLEAGEGGAIVNIGSTAGMAGNAVAAYSSSKWALRGLTKAAAMELAPRVRVNAVHPGAVRTAFTAEAGALLEAMASSSLAGRAASPEDIASIVLLIASPLSTHVNGQDIVVDGGFAECAAYLGVARSMGLLDGDSEDV